jgi:hypothetical protein
MTLHYVYGQDRNVAKYVASLIPHIDPAGFPATARAIGITDAGGEPAAGVVFYEHSVPAGTVYVAMAARPGIFWLRRETIARTARFVFDDLRCQMGLMRVRADAEHILRPLAAFGFKFIEVPRLYGRERDGVIARYTDDQWAASRYNKPITQTPQQEAA